MKRKVLTLAFLLLWACQGSLLTDSDADTSEDTTQDDAGQAEVDTVQPDTSDAADVPEADVPEDEAAQDPAEEEEVEEGCENNDECDDGDPCNGEEECSLLTHECVDGTPEDDGEVCGEDPRMICLDEECVESECGDGFVDEGAGEACEPPGEGSCSADCAFLCEGDEDCEDDGNFCNGEEYCNLDEYICDRRDVPEDGTPCGGPIRFICIDGACAESMCGDGFTDEGMDPPEECDDSNDEEGDGCDNDCTYSCHDDFDCDDGNNCTRDRCYTWSSHTCIFMLEPNTTMCRGPAGPCDASEFCDGESVECPEDGFEPSSTVCREAEDACDAAENCTGSSASCPDNAFAEEGTECNDDNDCTDPDTCDGGGRCSGPYVPGCCAVDVLEAGGYHTCALLSIGSLKCWGYNAYGAVGDGTTDSRSSAIQVSGMAEGVTAVSCGRYHNCAVMDTGGAKCWGRNYYGAIGDGFTTDRTTPVDVSGLTSGVAIVSAGGWHSCAILEAGGVRCWGANGYGQLGNGSLVNSATPVSVSGISSGVLDICLGGAHTCALMNGGGIKCWGYNSSGQVGDGTLTQRTTPIDVTGLSSDAVAIACGRWHTCALLDTGAMVCWGGNSEGQIGDGSTTDRTTPVGVTGLSSGVLAISTSEFTHTCALLDGGGMKCWGDNQTGQLGDGSTDDSTEPVDVTGMASDVYAISAGGYHTCALDDTRVAHCWGANTVGQLGDGTMIQKETPVVADVPCP